MIIRHITCSGPNEGTTVNELLGLLDMSPGVVELAMQVSREKAKKGTPRYEWLGAFASGVIKRQKPYALALHVNLGWCGDFCSGEGKPPLELGEFMGITHPGTDEPVFKRIQLNTSDCGRPVDAGKLVQAMKAFPKHEFILTYSDKTKTLVHEVYNLGGRFALLFDSSHGEGVQAKCWEKPVFDDVLQGYAGGLSPNNVEAELLKISAMVPAWREIWIDAEGQLKAPTPGIIIRTPADAERAEKMKRFDAGLAAAYVYRALKYEREHRQASKSA